LPELAHEFGVGPAAISTIMTASALAIALTAPFTGAIADMLGRKRVITAAMLAVVVPMAGASFAGDVPAEQAAFMADSQVPWGVGALGGPISEPAWRIKPSWYLVATEDRMIPPPAQRAMSERAGSTVVEVPGSHAIYLSQPAAVADLIKQAASAVAMRQ